MPRGVYIHKKGYKRPPRSKEWSDKISNALKGKPSSFKGKRFTPEQLERHIQAHIGIKYSKERNEKIAASMRGKRARAWKDGLSVSDPAAYARRQYRKTPSKRRSNQRRQSLKRTAGNITLESIQDVYESNIKRFEKLTCVYCFKHIVFGDDSLDHIFPIIKGGTNHRSNLTIACKRCNYRKGARIKSEGCYC